MTLVAGVDIGSTTAKAVLIKDGKPIASAVAPTGADCNFAAEQVLKHTLEQTGHTRKDVQYVVSTGYGRRAIDFGDETITEISANAKGAVFMGSEKGRVKSIIDVGGQDTKAIVLDDSGKITNFMMNDKCAAGTGRFLEVIAGVLNEPMDKFATMSLETDTSVTINSTCTVFAESEVISLIAKKLPKDQIIAGIHKSIGKRVAEMARHARVQPIVFFDGGGAKNPTLKKAIQKELNMEVFVPAHPQIVVALGAALFAVDKYAKKSGN